MNTRKESWNRAILSKVSIGAIIFAVIMHSFLPFPAEGAEIPALAPLNQNFLDRFQQIHPYSLRTITPEGHPFGLIPSPVDLSHLTRPSIFAKQLQVALPSNYDLRSLGRVSPVKNQGSCGDCWAFATYGSLESILLPAETWNFSENNLKNTSGFDFGPCSGGNALMSTAYLARWDGPVAEADDPYNPNPPFTSPAGVLPKKYLQEVIIIPDRTSAADNGPLKQALMDYGALYTTMYYNDPYYNAVTKAFSYGGTNDGCGGAPYDATNGRCPSNHGVTIVGWDDNFDRNNFSPAAPANGAFIIKNSWGTSWGENGFFYISYYDANVGSQNYAFNGVQSTAEYHHIYQYDPLGWIGSMGFRAETAWFANVFSSAASEQLSAVSFYTPVAGAAYVVDIYTNAVSGPISGLLSGTTSGTIAAPGYHTITLSSPVPVTAGEKFSVVVELTTPGYTYPIAIETPYEGYSSGSEGAPGQSYISSNGASWTDITTSISNTNVCVKAFTAQSAPATYTIRGKVKTAGGTAISGVLMTLGGAETGTTATDLTGSYKFSGLTNGSYTVQPSKPGYVCTPAGKAVNIDGADVTGQSFTCSPAAYAISGKVKTATGTPIAGVLVTLSGAKAATATTNIYGRFKFSGLANGSYTLRSSKTSYNFTPASRAVTLSGASVTGRNFTGVHQ